MGVNTGVVSKRAMRGQSTTEFLVMGLVLVPLFFLVVYVAKYFDMKQSAHQASRYAAFERSWDPDARFKSDEDIQGEVRARFFSTKREINFKDGLAHVSNDEADRKFKRPLLWGRSSWNGPYVGPGLPPAP